MMRRQSGVALITAILVVAVAVLASTALLSSGHLAMRRMAAVQDTEQAWWLVRGVEAWIMEILKQDNNEYDGLNPDEAWSQPVDYLPLDQGFLRGRIVDQQGLFNLNNLSLAKNDDPYAKQFRRLVERLGEQVEFDGPVPDLVPAIRDWMDADQFPNSSGAEDSDYLRLDPSYRAANRLFDSVSELRAVSGVSDEIYRALTTGCPLAEGAPPQPCVAALPPSRTSSSRSRRGRGRGTTVSGSPINVNTAPRLVLLALSDSTNEAALDEFLVERLENPATSQADFKDREIYASAHADERIDDQYDVKSEYFQIRGEVVVGSSRLPLYSLIRRTKPTPTVIAHGVVEE